MVLNESLNPMKLYVKYLCALVIRPSKDEMEPHLTPTPSFLATINVLRLSFVVFP